MLIIKRYSFNISFICSYTFSNFTMPNSERCPEFEMIELIIKLDIISNDKKEYHNKI